MDIDLSKVIGYSRDCLQSRTLMRSIILDLYPGKTREMNVLLDVYESGVPRKIKIDGSITNAKYAQYVQKIVDDYGMQEQWAVIGLNAWIDVCLGDGASNGLKFPAGTVIYGNDTSNQVPPSHILHKPIISGINVKGVVDEYDFTVTATGEIVIKKYLGFETEEMTVPNEINGKKVVEIGEAAYKACQGIKRLAIASGIKTIGEDAFSGCKNLQEVTIGEGTERIADGAFSGCSNLSVVCLPSSLTILGGERVKTYQSSVGVFSNTAIKEINMPNGVKKIGEHSFERCTQLTKVYLPDNLEVIADCAFRKCISLRELNLPSKVKYLKDEAFYGCENLEVVNLNEGLISIGEKCFSWCLFTKVLIPASVTTIGKLAFVRSSGKGTVTLRCYQGSKAVEYARLNNLGIEKA